MRSFIPILILALVHAFGGRFRHFATIPRSIWLSIAGGLSVAYVFMHLFPELHEAQLHMEEKGIVPFLKHHVYLMSLIGLCAFYGLERVVIEEKGRCAGDHSHRSPGVFWIHIISFAVYNALIGYLLYSRQDDASHELIFFAVAMGLHFLVNDLGLQQHHDHMYARYGRWLLVVALIAGWIIGMIAPVSSAVIMFTTAFVGGGIILNVLKEELPQERESRYWAFLSGVLAYTLVWQLL